MEKTLKIETNVDVQERYTVIGIMNLENGCCLSRPVLLTFNKTNAYPSGINYSCQCACGRWCTTGHETPGEAIDDYIDMRRRAGKIA